MCNKQKKKGTSSAKFTLDLAFNKNNDDEERLSYPPPPQEKTHQNKQKKANDKLVPTPTKQDDNNETLELPFVTFATKSGKLYKALINTSKTKKITIKSFTTTFEKMKK